MLKRTCVINLVGLYIFVYGMAFTAAYPGPPGAAEAAPAAAQPVAARPAVPVSAPAAPPPVPAPQPRAATSAGTIYWHGPADKRQVAITFDDGPHPEYTPQILAILDRHHAKATFFMVGEMARRYPEVARQVADRGNEVADHTMTHPEAPRSDGRTLRREVQEAARLIETVSGGKPHYFRPPYGYFDVAYFRACRDAGLDVVLWSVVPRDWEQPPAEILARRVAAEIRPGSVILLHDGGGDRRQTVKALPAIIDAIRAKGLEPVTLSRLLGDRP
ncbi:polysaccharide deacetylase family protein [Anaeroselena agilis]|uniref:Polysaccharide deacetylase family protein n=1 Tax=Anaeroselena agilis TaxID=3063788 RepID=A0ABU3P020_9FIRM|nr:polysaccharide deacetylase family protein [Selenomonadales bacterium 4137-cl]